MDKDREYEFAEFKGLELSRAAQEEGWNVRLGYSRAFPTHPWTVTLESPDGLEFTQPGGTPSEAFLQAKSQAQVK